MAGEWIKVETALPEKPEVMRIARSLNLEHEIVIGKLIRLWIWFDKNSVDGSVDGLVDVDVDDFVVHGGFASAMREVGWLVDKVDSPGLTIPNFDRHNGESAKKRALKNERQARWRRQNGDAKPPTRASTREEKRRVITPNPLFDRFWTAYPRKEAKPKALKAFLNLKLVNGDFERVMGALEEAKKSAQWTRDSGKFIPHPSSWLTQRRFEDEGTQAPRQQWTP